MMASSELRETQNKFWTLSVVLVGLPKESILGKESDCSHTLPYKSNEQIKARTQLYELTSAGPVQAEIVLGSSSCL